LKVLAEGFRKAPVDAAKAQAADGLRLRLLFQRFCPPEPAWPRGACPSHAPRVWSDCGGGPCGVCGASFPARRSCRASFTTLLTVGSHRKRRARTLAPRGGLGWLFVGRAPAQGGGRLPLRKQGAPHDFRSPVQQGLRTGVLHPTNPLRHKTQSHPRRHDRIFALDGTTKRALKYPVFLPGSWQGSPAEAGRNHDR
jgi:hypothetical protein